jgi:type I restriction enzyme S subunit
MINNQKHSRHSVLDTESKTPKLRFKEFSGEWEEEKLGSITTKIGSGNTPSGGEKVYTDKGVLFIRSQNVNNNILDLSDKTYIPENIHKKMKGSTVFSNDVLLNITGASIGRSCVVPNSVKEANVNQHVCIIRGTEKVESHFLHAFISSYQGQKLIYQGQTGSGREGLNFQSIASFKIPLPTQSEQQKIASFLSAIDTKITLRQAQGERLQQYKKGVMQKLFSQELRFKADEGSEFSEWEEKTLGEIAEKQIRKNKDNAINNVFSNSAVQGIVNQRDYFDKDIANQNNLLNYYIIEKDDFIYNPRISNFAPVGPIGRNHLGLGVMSPLYSIFKIKQGNLDFFEQYFLTSNWYEYMESIANYGARADRMNITSSSFYLMPLPFPSLEEQTKIVNFLTAIDTKIDLATQQLEEVKQFKKGLLQQMFV